jgi:hypothetical protein
MDIRVLASNDNPDIVALAYGPIILAGELGRDGMFPPAPFSDPSSHNDYFTYDYKVPASISNKLLLDISDPGKFILSIKDEAGIAFKTIKEGIVLRPLMDIHRQRYNVYWDISR